MEFISENLQKTCMGHPVEQKWNTNSAIHNRLGNVNYRGSFKLLDFIRKKNYFENFWGIVLSDKGPYIII